MNRERCAKSLNLAADRHLSDFFSSLNGMSPGRNIYADLLAEFEKPLLEHTLRYVGGNQIRAAAVLGINRNTLRKKLNAFNIEASHFKGSE
jgi:two-component system nitrogen regulation response regulator GlnG